jgi:hypothetical protein
MNSCPCCSDILLQHIKGSEIYWFCRSCWQEMPVQVFRNHAPLSVMLVIQGRELVKP